MPDFFFDWLAFIADKLIDLIVHIRCLIYIHIELADEILDPREENIDIPLDHSFWGILKKIYLVFKEFICPW